MDTLAVKLMVATAKLLLMPSAALDIHGQIRGILDFGLIIFHSATTKLLRTII